MVPGDDDKIIRLVREPVSDEEAHAEIEDFITKDVQIKAAAPDEDETLDDAADLLDPDDPLIAAASLSARDVADYLRAHPDFFHDQADLLERLSLPARYKERGLVDFQQVMLDQHRETLDELRDSIRGVIETSRSNMSITSRAHAAVLALLAARGLDNLVHVVTDDLPLLLDIDIAAVGYEPSGGPSSWLVSPDLRDLTPGLTDDLIGHDADAKLFASMTDDGTLFGGAAPLVQSAALARLRPGGGTPAGMLALGSRGAVFHPGQGTELVVFLARVLENCVDRLQESAPDA